MVRHVSVWRYGRFTPAIAISQTIQKSQNKEFTAYICVFTLSDTEDETDTETDNKCTKLNVIFLGAVLSVLHIIVEPIIIVLVIAIVLILGVAQCENTITAAVPSFICKTEIPVFECQSVVSYFCPVKKNLDH